MAGVITSPEVVCVPIVVEAALTLGVCATRLTVIDVVTTDPSRPPASPVVDACALNENAFVRLNSPEVGVKRSPAAPCATVIKLPSAIGVVPSWRNSVPPVIPVI